MNEIEQENLKHRRLSPSSMYRILPCPGSAQYGLPESNSTAADIGTLAHGRSKAALLNTTLEAEFESALAELDDEAFLEMTSAIQVYIDFCRGIPGVASVERELVSKFIPEYGGTVDYLAVHPTDWLHVVDLKYGVMFVPAVDNKQLLSYCGLAREHCGRRPIYYGTIVQPRVLDGRIQTVTFTNEDLDRHELDVIEASVDTTLRAGDHCKWCPLLQTCDVAYAHAKEMANAEFEEITEPDPKTGQLNTARLLEIMKFEDVVVRLAELCRAKILQRMQFGEKIEGWKPAMSYGHRAWKSPEQVAAYLLDKGVSSELIYHPPALKSPAQMEKEVPKSVLEPLWHRPERGIVPVPASSKMPEFIFDTFTELPQQ